MLDSTPLQLSSLDPFGVGGRRLCFEHPFDENLCVKVLRVDKDRTVRLKQSGRWKTKLGRVYDNNEDERRELDKLFKRHGAKAAEHFPKHYGYCETDLGLGLVLDLCRDYDGEVSMSVREWITRGFGLENLRHAFAIFSDFMIDQAILTKDVLDHNVVVHRESEDHIRLVLIDGIGHSAMIPLAVWIPFVARRKMKIKLDRAWAKFQQLEAEGGVDLDLIENSSWGQGIRYNAAINERLKSE